MERGKEGTWVTPRPAISPLCSCPLTRVASLTWVGLEQRLPNFRVPTNLGFCWTQSPNQPVCGLAEVSTFSQASNDTHSAYLWVTPWSNNVLKHSFWNFLCPSLLWLQPLVTGSSGGNSGHKVSRLRLSLGRTVSLGVIKPGHKDICASRHFSAEVLW